MLSHILLKSIPYPVLSFSNISSPILSYIIISFPIQYYHFWTNSISIHPIPLYSNLSSATSYPILSSPILFQHILHLVRTINISYPILPYLLFHAVLSKPNPFHPITLHFILFYVIFCQNLSYILSYFILFYSFLSSPILSLILSPIPPSIPSPILYPCSLASHPPLSPILSSLTIFYSILSYPNLLHLVASHSISFNSVLSQVCQQISCGCFSKQKLYHNDAFTRIDFKVSREMLPPFDDSVKKWIFHSAHDKPVMPANL